MHLENGTHEVTKKPTHEQKKSITNTIELYITLLEFTISFNYSLYVFLGQIFFLYNN